MSSRLGRIFAAAAIGIGILIPGKAALPQTLATTPLTREIFDQVIKLLKDEYVNPAALGTPEKFNALIERSIADHASSAEDPYGEALNTILYTLDPNSVYASPERVIARKQSQETKIVGIGVTIDLGKNGIAITDVRKDTPAMKAGLKIGDIITHINGAATPFATRTDIDEAAKLIRGPADTTITLTVQKPDEALPQTLTITRETITMSVVNFNPIDNQIGYINIVHFSNMKIREDVRDAVKKMGPAMQSYIIDLRGNTGGWSHVSVELADDFISTTGHILVQRGNAPDKVWINSGDMEDITGGKPIAILTNAYSASASEIFIGAMQDYKRATIIGTQTYGKGTVQTQFNLANRGDVRLTSALYYTPLGRSIQGIGITPDIAYYDPDMPPSFAKTESAMQNTIPNPMKMKEPEPNRTTATCSPEKKASVDAAKAYGGIITSRTTSIPDYQRLCAIEFLRGARVFTIMKDGPPVKGP